MTDEEYIELCAEKAKEDARYNLQRKNFIRPYEEVLEYFTPNNMTQEEFDAICNKMSLPVSSNPDQQEQQEPTCKTCGFYENNCPFIRGKLIPYPNKVCKDYTYSVMKEQEQLEAELEKELIDYYGRVPDDTDTISVARHFYELGLNARKEK